MLVLFETSGGYAIFKLIDDSKIDAVDNLYEQFESVETASKVVKLKCFEKFKDTTEALAAATAAVESKLSKSLKKLVKRLVAKDPHEKLAVADAKLGNLIREKFDLNCVYNTGVQELMRCIRSQMDSLIADYPHKEMAAMALGLAHGLSRYKLKFSADKIDTMIIQGIKLLDDLDKELNNYAMRCREWYGWHFPEMGKIISDQLIYAKTIRLMGMKENAAGLDFSDILPSDVEEQIKEAAEVSMGSEIAPEDIANISYMCQQVIDMTAYRVQLHDYISSRMMTVAPNLSIMAGELVGARLIAHAGSLTNLAKCPASTVQIMGSEKALFRALKTHHATPKYGLIYHASMVSQTAANHKGKVSRMMATKTALAVRYDALSDDSNSMMGVEHRARLEQRIRELVEGRTHRVSGLAKVKGQHDKFVAKIGPGKVYDASGDSVAPSAGERGADEGEGGTSGGVKRNIGHVETSEPPTKKKKHKRLIEEIPADVVEPEVDVGEPLDESETSKKKKKVKREKVDESQDFEVVTEKTVVEEPKSSKKKKVKKDNVGDVTVSEADVTIDSLETSAVSLSSKKKKKKKDKDISLNGDTTADVVEGIPTSPCRVICPEESRSASKKKKKKKDKQDDSLIEEIVAVPVSPKKKKSRAET